jgi:hypothetical protein
MNGYLVIGRTNLDDVPVRLCETRDEAEGFANIVTGRVVHAIADIQLNVDGAGLINVAIVRFHNGIPDELHKVKDLDDVP